MTSEVAILNKQAAILAADSAVTIGKNKVYKSSNKIFSLSPANDVAIMIFGSGEFSGAPWETILKLFRSFVGRRKFQGISEIESCFFGFLQRKSFRDDYVNDIFNRAAIVDIIENTFASIDGNSAIELRKSLKNYVKHRISKLRENQVCLNDFDLSEIGTDIEEFIKETAMHCCSNAITKGMLNDLALLIKAEFETSFCYTGYETGIVFCGFGEDQIFPCLEYFTIDGRIGDRIRYWKEKKVDIGDPDDSNASVLSFAQTDVSQIFMEGIDLSFTGYLEKIISDILDRKSEELIKNYVKDADEAIVEQKIQKRDNKDIVQKLMESFSAFRYQYTTKAMIHVIRSLPKEDMAQMAEALVEITSMRRKLDSNLETVAGPVDVAIITKGDGVIWHKRKHYFDLEKNMDFAYRRQKVLMGGPDETSQEDQ